jgi:hypothetical protein
MFFFLEGGLIGRLGVGFKSYYRILRDASQNIRLIDSVQLVSNSHKEQSATLCANRILQQTNMADHYQIPQYIVLLKLWFVKINRTYLTAFRPRTHNWAVQNN